MAQALKLYCQTTELSSLRKYIGDELSKTKIEESLKLQLVLAVEEVCANLIIHSHNCNAKEHILVKVQQTPHKVIFEIQDEGNAFNILEYKAPELEQVMGEKRKGGLGIILIKKIMDKIEFSSKGRSNLCRLIKRI